MSETPVSASYSLLLLYLTTNQLECAEALFFSLNSSTQVEMLSRLTVRLYNLLVVNLTLPPDLALESEVELDGFPDQTLPLTIAQFVILALERMKGEPSNSMTKSTQPYSS